MERGRARNSLRDGGRDPPLDLELEDCALRLDAEAKRTALTDHVADQDPEQGADEDAEDAAADRASDADVVGPAQQLVGEALDDLWVVFGRSRHCLLIGRTAPELEKERA